MRVENKFRVCANELQLTREGNRLLFGALLRELNELLKIGGDDDEIMAEKQSACCRAAQVKLVHQMRKKVLHVCYLDCKNKHRYE